MIPSVPDRRRRTLDLCILAAALAASSGLPGAAHAETARQVTQYGITWTFDKAYPVGRFVTGDYWVVGPVTVVSVSPAPAPAPATEPATSGASIYGATNLTDDKRMRNGSMIFTGRPKKTAASAARDTIPARRITRRN